MNTFKENMLQYLSFGLVFLMPLMFWGHGLFPHISSKTFFIYAMVEALFFLWVYISFRDRQYRLTTKTLLMFLIPGLVLVWMTLATVFSVNPTLSFWSTLGRGTGLLTFYHVFLFAIVTASLVKRFGMLYIVPLFEWFVYGSGILAFTVWMGVDGFGLPATVLKTDAGGGFAGNSTLAASYFLFTLTIAVFLLSTKNISKTKRMGIYTIIAIIIFSPVFASLYRLFSSGNILGTARGTILALVAGVVMTSVAYMFFSKKRSLKITSLSIVGAGLITFIIVWMQLITPQTYLHQKFTEQARGSRFIFWDIAQKAIDTHPVLGYGPESYSIAFQDNFNPQILRAENSFEGWADRAHNIYYDLGVSGGYPLIILYALFLSSLLYALFWVYKKGTFSRFQTSLFFGLIVAYVVNNLMTFDSNISLTALFIITGIVYALYGDNGESVPLKKRYTDSSYDVFLGGVIIVICITCFVFFVQRPIAKSKAYAEIFVLPIDIRAKSYDNLLKGSPVGEQWDIGGLADDIYKVYAADPAKYKNDTKLLPYIIQDLKGLIDYSEKVHTRNPTDYRLLITIVHLYSTLIYLENTNPDPTLITHLLDLLDKAKKLAPTNPNVYWSMAQMYVWKGDFKSAENAYKEGIAIDPGFAASHRLLIQFAEIIGNKELYTEALKQAEEDIPGFTLKN